MYKRKLEKTVRDSLFKGKVIIIYGPRQVGKTTLAKKILTEHTGESLFIQCDVPSQREKVSRPEPLELKRVFGSATLVVLDEAQTIENIGLILKVFVDTYPDVQIIATGSSSFDLANKIREPLTGRAYEFMMYPLSVGEVIDTHGMVHAHSRGDAFFRYGMYPGVIDLGEKDAALALGTLENNTFYKDIFTLEQIRKPAILETLLKVLAYNIGSTLTINGLMRDVKTSAKTVERYLTILEQMFVIKILRGYYRNKNTEIHKGFKVYFVDIGLRNSIAENFSPLTTRLDKGGVFENVWVMERIKKLDYDGVTVNVHFWQGERGLELDYVEECNGILTAYECKYSERSSKAKRIFLDAYAKEGATVTTITRENYADFL